MVAPEAGGGVVDKGLAYRDGSRAFALAGLPV